MRKQQEDALKEAGRRKSEFLAILAHELRNPLAPIRSAVHLLQTATLSRDVAQPIYEMMERHVAQMVRIIDDLLDVSRVDHGKIELRYEQVELSRVLQQAAETVQALCSASDHELSITLPAKPLYLIADPVRLTQIVGNLLSNACKFTPNGGRIGLAAEAEGEQVAIRVTDRGVGIAPEDLPRIFEMFTQVDSSSERESGGVGIGLTLVKSLVEMHGGTVEASSSGPGRGSEFVVRLPALAGLPLPRQERVAVQPAPSLSRRVLVVDDNVDAAEGLTMLLRLSGHEVSIAHDGIEALEQAARSHPDVVLLDIGMPKLNGYAAASRIRMQSRKPVLIIAMTGWGEADDRRRSSEAGFDAHLVKPIRYDDLSTLLAQLPGGAPM